MMLEDLDLPELVAPIIDFFQGKQCYDFMPPSGKVIVFDIDLHVKDAFRVAVQNDITFATLWDSRKQEFVGMFTVTDFIEILQHFHTRTNVIKELAEHRIRKWREISLRNRPLQLCSVTAEDTLFTVIKALKQYRIHRLPVIQDGNLLHIVTHSPILTYLVQNIDFDHQIFRLSIEELGIGTYEDVITCKKNTKLVNIFNMLTSNAISAIPIVNDDDEVVDVYSRYDVMFLAQQGEYNLEITVEAALDVELRPKIPVFTCMKSDSFESVLRHLSRTRVHRLVCVDANAHVVGVVSISDVFDFFLKYADSYN